MEQNQSEKAEAFDVLLDDAGDVSAVSVAEAIAAFKKVPFQDAAHDGRLAWGFIGKNLSDADATSLAAIMAGKNLRARVVASGSIPPLPAAQPVKALSLDGTGLHVTTASDTTEIVTPAQLVVIGGLGLPMRSVKHEKIIEGPTNAQRLLNVGLMMAGVPISVGKKKRVIDKTTITDDLLFYADLLATSPSRRFRIDAQSLSYAFLKERMLHNTLQNFKTLLRDLTQWAPKAHVNRGARMLVKNLILSQMGYDSFAHLEQETLWLSALPL